MTAAARPQLTTSLHDTAAMFVTPSADCLSSTQRLTAIDLRDFFSTLALYARLVPATTALIKFQHYKKKTQKASSFDVIYYFNFNVENCN